jgi:hypothetical protein
VRVLLPAGLQAPAPVYSTTGREIRADYILFDDSLSHVRILHHEGVLFRDLSTVTAIAGHVASHGHEP